MNRLQQILVGKRLARLPSKEADAGVGSFQLVVRQMQLQRAETAGVERRLQQIFAFRQIGQDRAGLILTPPAANRGADDAHQRGRMKRPLEKGDVAEHLPEPRRIRIALGTAALMRQQHDRKIRPWRLTIEPVHQAAQIRGLDRLVGDHGEAGAALDLA